MGTIEGGRAGRGRRAVLRGGGVEATFEGTRGAAEVHARGAVTRPVAAARAFWCRRGDGAGIVIMVAVIVGIAIKESVNAHVGRSRGLFGRVVEAGGRRGGAGAIRVGEIVTLEQRLGELTAPTGRTWCEGVSSATKKGSNLGVRRRLTMRRREPIAARGGGGGGSGGVVFGENRKDRVLGEGWGRVSLCAHMCMDIDISI